MKNSNQNQTYDGMDFAILMRIGEKEQQYRQEAHTGTRCELLNAYGEAADYAQENGASYDEIFSWREKACVLAENGVQTEPCFISCWDAAVVCINCGNLAQSHSRNQEARGWFKKAAAYLERIQEEQMRSPVDGCDVPALLRQVYAVLASM